MKNRIVVQYEEEDLVFLSAFEKGIELPKYISKIEEYKFNIVYKYLTPIFNYNSLKNENESNREGYVIKFSNGERCKIKFDEYIRLHRIMTDVSSYRVYEALRDGIDLEEWLEGVPDEFFGWIKKVEKDILRDYYNLKAEIYNSYANILSLYPENDKKFAEYAKNEKIASHPSCMFSLKNGKSIEPYVWKHIKPELSYPFKSDLDDQ